ncbi:hypothetical protein MYMAC_003599 [Corallococcus macrosporus DSM 14697]|uniref:Uncharacterized protein n=2 Tax=Corallococcus macrosporus TaxID=35 RepID=A0A250JXY1_9BACT|nr:hypothetical protein MYMAC_003599 [Corallococcus macrosporus DSM 14697]
MPVMVNTPNKEQGMSAASYQVHRIWDSDLEWMRALNAVFADAFEHFDFTVEEDDVARK